MTDIEIPLGRRRPLYRFFEIVPGAISATMITAPFFLSFFSSLLASIFVLLYIISFFVRSLAISGRVIKGYRLLRQAEKIDWASRLADCEDIHDALTTRGHAMPLLHRRNLERTMERSDHFKPSEVYNAVIIATYNESIDVLEPTVQSVIDSEYDLSRMILMIAYEERGGVQVEQTAKHLQKRYGSRFKDFLIVKHPKDLPNEVPGKGANITFAGFALQRYVEAHHIDPRRVIVTTLDSDNRPHPLYFSYLTYEYIVHPDPYHAAFQPMTLFLNNIWDVPAPMRVVATGNSFWNLVVSQRQHLLRNFASHSQGLAPLIDMKFWSTRTIVEDGHQFWRSYFHFDGEYQIVPLFVP